MNIPRMLWIHWLLCWELLLFPTLLRSFPNVSYAIPLPGYPRHVPQIWMKPYINGLKKGLQSDAQEVVCWGVAGIASGCYLSLQKTLLIHCWHVDIRAVTIPKENNRPKRSIHLKMLKPERKKKKKKKKKGIVVATFWLHTCSRCQHIIYWGFFLCLWKSQWDIWSSQWQVFLELSGTFVRF
jgi:hypothetical protein